MLRSAKHHGRNERPSDWVCNRRYVLAVVRGRQSPSQNKDSRPLYTLLYTLQWAKEWFGKVFNFVQDKYPLKKHGYALWDFWPDRKVAFVEHYSRVGNFHHPRHLMLNLLSIERMIGRSGKASDVSFN